MPAKPVRSARLPEEPLLDSYIPFLPTVVVASYKGGVWRTSLAVAIAERLCWAGLHVLLISSDRQEDARSRLGVKGSEPPLARRTYGHGCIDVVGLRGSKVVDLLYRLGPDRLGVGTFDIVVLDTPPEVQGGSLPGVLLVTPLDGVDAARHLLTMARRTPTNTDIVLVRVGEADPIEWAQNADSIEQALERPVQFLDEPLPRSSRVATAHNEGKSVWSLQRTGYTLAFLRGVEALSQMAWERVKLRQTWPTVPPASSSAPFVPGWDEET